VTSRRNHAATPLFGLALVVAACTGSMPPTVVPTASPAATAGGPSPAPTLDPTPVVATTAASAGATGGARDLTGAFSADVSIGDRALFVRCSERVPGAPTVIFEGGLGADSTAWGWVVSEVWGFARACTYDRANVGRSDPTGGPVTSEDVADDLHALLGAAGIKTPVVVVAHSLGGLHARVFAARFSDDIAAVVFLDPTPPYLPQRGLALLPPEEANEPPELSALRRDWEAAENWNGEPNDPERLDLGATSDQAAAVAGLGDTPVIVLSADTQFGFRDPALKPVEDALEAWVLEASEEYAALSTNGVHEVVERSGHDIPRDRPDAVVDAIRRVIDSDAEGGWLR
jgi:pimeloyl-ACP methyl ester carboxylesterase